MYTMKQTCELTNMSYETLKFYCNQGLVPNVKRDQNNHRVFDDRDVAWIKSLSCLRDCDLSIAQMRQYVRLCMEGKKSIPQRQAMLAEKRQALLQQQRKLQAALDYIDWKQRFYADVLSGRQEYTSNLLAEDEIE